MKRILCSFGLIIFAALFTTVSAQFYTKTAGNLHQPKWAPAGQNSAEYYFLPDIDTYYYVRGKQFIYQSGGYWTFSSYLPANRKKYNLYSANKIAINEPGAYRYYAEHKAKYGNAPSNASVKKDEPAISNTRSVIADKKAG